jgi:hypothetical protein
LIEIVPGTLRDVSWIVANMRAIDWQEVAGQFLTDPPRELIVALAMQASPQVVMLRGQPEAAFGCSPLMPGSCTWQIWAFGTDRFKRCVPTITRYGHAIMAHAIQEQGATRVECRSMSGHDLAGRWLTACGAVVEKVLKGHGRDGLDYILWAWTKESYSNVLLKA